MLFRQVFAALLYGVSSLAIMFVNKIVLTEYGFPSFNAMAFFQTLTSLLMLTSARALGFISYAPIVTFFLPFPPFLCPFFFNSLLIPFPRTFPTFMATSNWFPQLPAVQLPRHARSLSSPAHLYAQRRASPFFFCVSLQ